MYNVMCRVPKVFLPLIKLIAKTVSYIPEEVEDEIENLIEDDKYEEARAMIEDAEKRYGVSVYTVRLETRIYRFELLGKE